MLKGKENHSVRTRDYRAFFDFSLDCLFIVDLQGTIIEANQCAYETLKLAPHETIGRKLKDLVSDGLRLAAEDAQETLRNTESYAGEFPMTTGDGHSIPFEWRARSHASNGFVFWSGRNITQQRIMEKRLRAEAMQKGTLLKETHHRIKNNLQTLSSLLNLQASLDGVTIADVLREYNSRIKSVALIHDDLYISEDSPAMINLCSYLESLAKNLCSTYGVSEDRVRLLFDFEPVSISYEQAVPCGLIANEIISNSLKYAFSQGKSGEIRIRLRQERNATVIDLSDDGIGLPETVDLNGSKTLGLRLVRILVVQLRGKLVLTRDGGTHFHIELPI